MTARCRWWTRALVRTGGLGCGNPSLRWNSLSARRIDSDKAWEGEGGLLTGKWPQAGPFPCLQPSASSPPVVLTLVPSCGKGLAMGSDPAKECKDVSDEGNAGSPRPALPWVYPPLLLATSQPLACAF